MLRIGSFRSVRQKPISTSTTLKYHRGPARQQPCMIIVVRSANRAFLVPNPALSTDKYLHSAANLLCLNSVMAPAIELRGGEVSIETDTNVLAAVTGDAEVRVDGRRAAPWSAIRVAQSLEVKSPGRAYISLKGLRSNEEERVPLSAGTSLSSFTEELDGVSPRVLAALKIPPSFRSDGGDWLQAVSRLQKYLAFLTDIVQKGAELIRVNLGGVEYEAWVLELR